MTQLFENVKSVTLRIPTCQTDFINEKQAEQSKVLQAGDRVVASICGDRIPGKIQTPQIHPDDFRKTEFRGAEFRLPRDPVWRVHLLSEFWFICAPRELVELEGGES